MPAERDVTGQPAAARRPAWSGRRLAGLRWVVPVAVLALMPKCPLCLAGYIALATGIGLSFAASSWLRLGLIILSVTALVCFAGQAIRMRRGRDGHRGGVKAR